MLSSKGDIVVIRIAICDDEEIICKGTKKSILELRPEYEVDIYNSGEQLVLSDMEYDIVFLDIEMPDKDGMTIAKELRDNNYSGHIVFLTGHTEFMTDAFKVKAFRFLEKPIDMEELAETFEGLEKETFECSKIVVANGGIQILINVSDILYIKSKRNKSLVYTLNDVIETNNTLKYWLQKLDDAGFIMVHRTCIVSLRHIMEIDEESVFLSSEYIKVPIARRNIGMVKKSFLEYVKKNSRCIWN